MKTKYYNLRNILEKNAEYNMIIGERSNGKTYACLEYALKMYKEKGQQSAYLRRWADDFIGKRGSMLFAGLESSGAVSRIFNGEWTGVYYYGSRWFLCRYEDSKRIMSEEPFCYGFALSSMEHDKSTSYPKITTIIFDEFLSRTMYLGDEFLLFTNTLSTIIRDRHDVKIFMLGNTVTKFCPYFKEMGLKHIKEQKQGSIDIYHYGQSGLTVAVEYCLSNKEGKESDVYFAFDNPRLSMITSGAYEMDIYPHCPVKFLPKDILYTYFISFDSELFQCEIVNAGGCLFTFIHPKTTELKNPDHDLIYSPEFDPRPNWRRYITKPTNDLENRIADFYRKDKIFYSDNETGEGIRNYLQFCGKG